MEYILILLFYYYVLSLNIRSGVLVGQYPAELFQILKLRDAKVHGEDSSEYTRGAFVNKNKMTLHPTNTQMDSTTSGGDDQEAQAKNYKLLLEEVSKRNGFY